jgi:thymidylate synthase (FAD)
MVYCAEVPSHTLFVRRNGIPVWCGNSVLEHVNVTFLIEGVSRSLTHELVRHRAGFAYSQLSQRYVDSKDVAFVMPLEIEKATGEVREVLERIFLTQCATALLGYTAIAGALEERIKKEEPGMKRSDLVKRVRQVARSVLPNATETKIVVTANARAWRHFLNMRGSKFAEPEIRRLAVHLCARLKEVCGPLFYDFKEVEMPVTSGLECTYAKP